MSKLFSYPDDPQEYRKQVTPHFEAAKEAYPNQVEHSNSVWQLMPNPIQPGEIILVEHSQDDNPNPIHHWQFRMDKDDLTGGKA